MSGTEVRSTEVCSIGWLGGTEDYDAIKFHERSHLSNTGPAITVQHRPDISTDIKTAALAISFACFDSVCSSIDIRFTVVSMAEFINSTSTTNIMDRTSTRCSMSVTGKSAEIGTSTERDKFVANRCLVCERVANS